jgi:hydrogenase/urease accessory protein HupE
LPNAALAHPGDHSHINTLIHLLTEADHLLMMALAVSVVGLVLYRKRAKQKADKK